MSVEYGAVDDTFYFHFAANDTGGSGADGATPTCDVRLCGAAADAAPVYSPTPALLTHADYPAGAHEVAIVASAANGFAAGNTYGVFCALAVDGENPTGFVGKFRLDVPAANVAEIGGVAQSATDLKDFADTGYDPSAHKVQGVVLTDTCTTNSDMRGTDSANTVTPDAAGVAEGLIGSLETHGDGAWATATGFNVVTPDAAGVAAGLLSALETHGDGAWATATGFATSAALTTHDGKLDVVDGIVDTILVDTNDLQTNQGNWVTAAGFATSADLATHDSNLGTVYSAVGAIKDVTDLLPDVGALSSLATATALATVDGVADAIKVVTDKFVGMLVLDDEVYKFTENALEEAPSGSGGDATLAKQEEILAAIALVEGSAGPGADQVTLTLEDSGGTPVADADVWITTDEAGSNTIAGTLQTNSSGQVMFLLDDGLTYYRWAQKDGYDFTNPSAFVAVAD